MRWLGSFALFVGCGCSFDGAVQDNARIACQRDEDCPTDQRCVEGVLVCADPAAACVLEDGAGLVAQVDGTPCGDAAAQRVCLTAACVQGRCGDGVLDGRTEECDDGSANSDEIADACRTSCVAPRCGDGVQDTFESCDRIALNAERCELCVASCGFLEGSCDGSDGDLCDCTPALLAAEPVAFENLFAIVADADFAYTVGAAGELRRTDLTGGPSEVLAAPPPRNEVLLDMVGDEEWLYLQGLDLDATAAILYRVNKQTGFEQYVTASAALAIDAEFLWLSAGALFRVRKADFSDAIVVHEAAPYAAERVAVTATHVVFSDEAGIVRALPTSDPLGAEPLILAERQFSVTSMTATATAAAWIDGDTVWLWSSPAASPEPLARLSDGQQGLEVRDVALMGDAVYIAVEDRSERRPGGVMRLLPGAPAWTLQWRGGVFRIAPSPAGLVLLSSDGLRVLPTP